LQLHLAPISRPRPPPRETIPYSSATMRQDLERLRGVWDDCQASRDRKAIYAYLSAVYGLVAWWTAEGREVDRVRRALRSQRLEVSDREDAFARSSGAPPTRPRPTNERGASGAGSCGTQRCTAARF
jgi:hypothetical protein